MERTFAEALETFDRLRESAFALYLIGVLVVGVALTYFGRRLYHLAIILVGAAIGWLLGMGMSDNPLVILAAMMVGGASLFFLHQAAIFVSGAFVGGLLGAAYVIANTGDDNAALIVGLCALAGGGMFLALAEIMLVLSTAFAGALLLVYCGAMMIVLLDGGSALQTARIGGMVVDLWGIWRPGALERAGEAIAIQLGALIAIFASGAWYQFTGKGVGALGGARAPNKTEEGPSIFAPQTAAAHVPEPARLVRFDEKNGENIAFLTLAMIEREGGIVIGRSAERTPALRERLGVSREHLRLMVREAKVYVEDLNSSNGTVLNGRTLNPGDRYEVRSGDVIDIGGVVCAVSVR